VLCLQHNLDRAEGIALRSQHAGNQCLFRVGRHKRGILADPEARGDDAAEVAVAVALVRLHLLLVASFSSARLRPQDFEIVAFESSNLSRSTVSFSRGRR
jgi:hypothetical protein